MYFRRINTRLNRTIKIKKPLILAGTEALLPIYRRINTYPNLAKEDLKGNFEHIPLDTLRERANQLITNSKIDDKFKKIIVS